MITVCWYAFFGNLSEDETQREVERDLKIKQQKKDAGKGGITNRVTHMLKK